MARIQDDPRLTVEQHNAAWEVWEAAWDAARDADERAGRRYDKDRYAEAASIARRAFLASCLEITH